MGTVSNVLPSLDPTVPLKPENILPFDATAANAKTELDQLVEDQWESYPVIVLGKLRDPKMHTLREVLHRTHEVRPQPTFIEYDQRGESWHCYMA